MHLEDYFDFLAPDDIRIKGHRIGIETILYEYIHRAQTPEEIAGQYDTINLEQVYATILYYLHNKEQVSSYVADWLEQTRRARERQKAEHPEYAERIRLLRANTKDAEQPQDSR